VIKKILALGGVFLISFSFFLILFMPASFVWERALKPSLDLRPYGVSIAAVDGTIWNGRALVLYKNLESLVSWSTGLPSVLSLSLPFDVDVNSHAGTASLNVAPGFSESALTIHSLDVNLAALNGVLSQYRVKVSGTLLARNLLVQTKGRKISSAAGQFSWSGGEIAYPVQREIHERSVPVMKGAVTTDADGLIQLNVRDDGGEIDSLTASLTPEGLALLQVKRRLLDLVDEPWSPNSNEQDTVFKVKKSVY